MSELEECADWAIECLRNCIHTEEQVIKEEHEFVDKLLQWENVIPHLWDIAPDDMEELDDLSCEILDTLARIRDIIEKGEYKEMRFVKEEEEKLELLEDEVRHREWKAVRKTVLEVPITIDDDVSMLHDELKDIHSQFSKLMGLMKESRLKEVLEKSDLERFPNKEEYEKQHEYYFVHLYKFFRAYERIFRDLYRKERKLSRKLRKASKKVDKETE